MMEDQKPNSPTAAINSPSRKRLLANPKPNQILPTAASLESTLSSHSSSDQHSKKTRELPNLSDCHSCGLRINYTNPRERLQPLDSAWRIVLLCRKCSKLVKAEELCPYCFSGNLESDFFKCRDCERRIHRDCVIRYGGSAPFSYTSKQLGSFSVCVDCWVPKSVVNSIRVHKKSRKKNKDVPPPLPNSGALVSNCDGTSRRLEEVVKDANTAVENKITALSKAKENALRKAVVAKNAVELANGALDLVSENDETGLCCSGSDSSEIKVVDDAELAFMLHRAMNSSPRISRNICSINSSLVVPEMQVPRETPSTGDSSRLSERIDSNVSKPSDCFKASDYGSFVGLGTGAMVHAQVSAKNECRGNGEGRYYNVKPDRYLLKYHRIHRSVSTPSAFSKASDRGSCTNLDHKNTGAMSDTRNCLNGNEYQENGVGRCIENPNRYLLTYRKRCKSSKPVLSCEMKVLPDSFHFENQDSAKPVLKYKKRSISSKPVLNREMKVLRDSFHFENQESSPLLPLKCYKEFSTLSAATIQSCTQAFACASGSSQEQP